MSSNQSFASPTESEFSDVEGPESAKNWDEERVCDWLVSVNCGEYEKLFRKNNINGENLLEMDKAVLQEMGIDKIGDRVRLFLNIKKLRTKAYANQKKRNRVCVRMQTFELYIRILTSPGLLCRSRRLYSLIIRFTPSSQLWQSSYSHTSSEQKIFKTI